MGAAVERLAAHIGRRLVGNADGQQHLAVEAAFAHRVVAVIGAIDRFVRPHMDAVGTMEQPLAPGGEEIALAVEDHHRMGAAIEDVDAVAMVDADSGNLLQRPAVGQLAPALRDAKAEPTGAKHDRHGESSQGAATGALAGNASSAAPAGQSRPKARLRRACQFSALSRARALATPRYRPPPAGSRR